MGLDEGMLRDSLLSTFVTVRRYSFVLECGANR